ncbi:MAG: lipid-A-disaccharide synthase [Candidatus Zixiibacteriota bacterium]|nr:MAG: lipid-A-disaccharide synthase [candidate division Zixibacteria bacterium]
MDEPRKILMIAGEASGDLHGSGLVRELRKRSPGLEIFGIGGDKMKREGVELIFHVDKLAFMGFFEVLKNLSFVRRVMKSMVSTAETRKPDLAILIDYPGFNLRFARRIKELRIPVVYYISPQVWAWGGNRVKKMQGLIDKMVVILPFEKEIYDRFDIDCEFVGHPFLEVTRPVLSLEDFRRKFDIRKNETTVGLLPGSRWQEVEKILPIMLESCRLLQTRAKNLKVLLGLAPTINKDEIQNLQNVAGFQAEIVENLTYDLMKHADLLLIASGSATLECAILGTPFMVLYRTSFWTYLVAKSLVSIRNIALANVVAGKRVVPEFVQNRAVPARIAEEMYEILTEKERYRTIQNELGQVKERLGEVGASSRAAEIVMQVLGSQSERRESTRS